MLKHIDDDIIYSDMNIKEYIFMLYWALVFFIVSIIAGVLGFSGVAAASASIAQIFFVFFLCIFLLLLLAGGIGVD